MRKYFSLLLIILSFLIVVPAFASIIGNSTNKTCYNYAGEAVNLTGGTSGSTVCCNASTDELIGTNNDLTSVSTVALEGSGLVENVCGGFYDITTVRIIKTDNQDAVDECGGLSNCSDCDTALAGFNYYSNIIDYDFNGCAIPTIGLVSDVVIDTGSAVATNIFTTIWPYFLILGVLLSLVIFIKKLSRSYHLKMKRLRRSDWE